MVKAASLAALVAAFLSVASAAPVQTNDTITDAVDAPDAAAVHHGVATFYYQQGVAGSCGTVHQDSAHIAALSPSLMNSGHYCGRKIKITNKGGGQDNPGKGKTVTVTVADTCEGCDTNHLDLSTGAFKVLTKGHLDPPGTFNIDWHFL